MIYGPFRKPYWALWDSCFLVRLVHVGHIVYQSLISAAVKATETFEKVELPMLDTAVSC